MIFNKNSNNNDDVIMVIIVIIITIISTTSIPSTHMYHIRTIYKILFLFPPI